MTQETILWNRCRTGSTQGAKEILAANNALDLTYDSGGCFKFAINANNPVLLELLLRYYEHQKLSCNRESLEYKQALFNLRKILDDAEDMFYFSKEVKKVLQPYYSVEGDEGDSSDDLSDADHPLLSTAGLGSSDESIVGPWVLHSSDEEHEAHHLGQESGCH